MSDLHQTPLYELHVELGGKMVPFAGYAMPVQYPMGVMKEHLHTRSQAGLFDVSHMGQVMLSGASWEAVAAAFETLVPMDVLGLADGRQRYGLFTNDTGGIEDDLMFARRGDDLFVVVNAACKGADIARMKAALEPEVTVTPITDRALIAVQGPTAAAAVASLDAAAADMRFMDVGTLNLDGIDVWASRSGYTGEDGFEISVPDAEAEALARRLLALDGVEAIGLGARDSLRLEAGLCLYGNDIDAQTNPVEASLTWAIQKVRRKGGDREGGFPGADAVQKAFEGGWRASASGWPRRAARRCAKACSYLMPKTAVGWWAVSPRAVSDRLWAGLLPWAMSVMNMPAWTPRCGARCAASGCLSVWPSCPLWRRILNDNQQGTKR